MLTGTLMQRVILGAALSVVNITSYSQEKRPLLKFGRKGMFLP
jgi:hypothetical protein